MQSKLKRGLLPPSSGWIKIKAEGSFETLLHIYQTTHRSIAEEYEWDIHYHEVLKTDDNITNGNPIHTLHDSHATHLTRYSCHR
jgi:hypothetical protein